MGRHRTRGSSADREMRCAGAIGYNGPRIDEAGPEARLGTAVDRALGMMAVGLEPDLDTIAHSHGVDRDELGMAYHGGLTAWRKVRQWVELPGSEIQVQRRIDGVTVCGTADLVSMSFDGTDHHNLVVLDWKLGMSDDEHTNQLKTYTLGLCQRLGQTLLPATLIEIHCMPADYIVTRVDEHDIAEFSARIDAQHAQAGRQFAPGDWCKYCPRAHDCSPRDEYLRGSARALAAITGGNVIPREALGQAYDASRQLGRVLRAYDKALKIALKDGPIESDAGRIELVETETDVISATVAMERIPDDLDLDLDKLCSVSKASIKRAIKSVAVKGKAAAAERAFLANIEAHDGLSTKTKSTVKLVKR